jgi:nucleoside 2-deoxyribosyltransferase
MGRFRKVIVYLAAPIDFDKGSRITKLKDEIKAHFKEQECVWVYDPAGAWNAPTDLVPDEFVHWSNLKVLEDADIVVAVLLRSVFTIGTIVEIQHAVDKEIPVVVIGDVGMNSVALAALEAPVFESIKEWSDNGSPIVPRLDANWPCTD